MATPESVGAERDLSLDELQTVLQQMEAQLGPVIRIGHGPAPADGAAGAVAADQDITVLTFDMDQDPPAKKATLRQTVGDQAPDVPGSTLICKGQCYVTGQLIGIAAYRGQ
jgi:hypothetical protein